MTEYNPIKLSVIIPARNEFPQVVFTIYSIIHAWEADYDPNELEIILVDNCSEDKDPEKPATRGTTSYLEGRGIFWSRHLRILRDPIAGNHSARNKGAEIARGKYVFFSDAHMSYRPHFFKYMFQAIDESGGMFHAPIGWLGAYPPVPTSIGYQYTIKLGEEIKGTWAQRCLSEEDWFYVPALGHCSVGFLKDQYLDFGGYPKVHRAYGGGEFYIDMKWWMFGSTIVTHPKAIGYHLSAGRGYTYHHDHYMENVLGIAYALGMDDWRERAYLNWLRKRKKETLDEIMKRNEKEYAEERKFVEERRKKTFNEMLVEQPWNKLNEEKFGRSNGGLQILHDTWIDLIYKGIPNKDIAPAPPHMIEAYENSKHQKALEEFINKHLSEYVYKRKR